MSASSVLGVWTAASRQKGSLISGEGDSTAAGPFVQVSRLGNPLFNEVIVPMGDKDRWNAVSPDTDIDFEKYVLQNFTGGTQADYLRLNVAIPPSANQNPAGLVGGDAAGYPNGRRLLDDVVTIELRAIAGLTIPLVDPSFTPDDAAGAIQDGSYKASERITLSSFPYVGPPHSGYRVPGE